MQSLLEIQDKLTSLTLHRKIEWESVDIDEARDLLTRMQSKPATFQGLFTTTLSGGTIYVVVESHPLALLYVEIYDELILISRNANQLLEQIIAKQINFVELLHELGRVELGH